MYATHAQLYVENTKPFFDFYYWKNLGCKTGGLFISRHNEICDGVADLANKAFTLTHVRENPLINVGRAVQRPKAQPKGSKTSQ